VTCQVHSSPRTAILPLGGSSYELCLSGCLQRKSCSKLPIQARKGAAMDVPNLDTLEQEWKAFLSAPYIITPLIVGAGVIGWWLRGNKVR
jgi:hypothetical protein